MKGPFMYVHEKMQRLNNIHVYLGQGLHCSQVTCYACFSVVCYFLFKTTLNFSGIPSKCQTVWIQIKPDILSCLIWVQLICKGYQRPTLVSRQIYAITAKISWAGPNMTMVFKRLIIFASFVCLFDLILYVHSTIFQLCGTGLPGLNQY